MNKIASAVAALVLAFVVKAATAAEYGDLYNVEWCPCNPEDQYDARGSVVLGKTVMCPCDSMYDGYGSNMERDLRKVQNTARQAVEKAKNFKYYVGFDYNKSQVDTGKGNLMFQHDIFSDIGGVAVPAGLAIDHQDNIGLVFGARPHTNFGIEAFYNRTYSDNKVTQFDNRTIGNKTHHMVNTFTSKYQAFGVDVLGYLPVTDYFDFIAFVGLGQYKFDNQAKFEVRYLEGAPVDEAGFDFSEDKLGWRLGAGFQFNISRGLVLRAMYRYIKIDTEAIKYLQEYSVGLRFLF